MPLPAIDDKTKNERNQRLPDRIADLKGWVEYELGLPEGEQIPMHRLDSMVRQYLGEFGKRARLRAMGARD